MPGEKVSNEAQLAWLVEKLTGHPSFHALRGRLEQPAISFMIGHVAADGSRRASQEKFRQFTEDIILIQSIIAKLERDGWTYALKQLKLALTISGYLFPEETIPIDQTTHMLLIIPNAPQTLAVLQWAKEYMPSVTPSTVALGKAELLFPYLPSLSSILEEIGGQWEDQKTIYIDIDHFSTAFSRAVNKDLSLPKRPKIHRSEGGFLFPSRVHSPYVDEYGWLIPLDRQKDFLSQIPRPDQDKLTTWHFHLPEAAIHGQFRGGTAHISIGIHPAEEHSHWQKTHPAFTSADTKEEHGAICWPHCESYLGDYPQDNLVFKMWR